MLRAFVATLTPLSGLTPEAVDRYLAGVRGPAGNRKKHVSAISVFVAWLIKKDRIGGNPLDRVDVPDAARRRNCGARRGPSPEGVRHCRQRPLDAFVRRYGPDARDAVLEKLDRRGRKRALLYRIAAYTGFRLGEIAALRPCHLEPERKPFPRVEIPGKFTKNDQKARLLLVPNFAGELAAWIGEAGKGPDDPLLHVPQASVRIMRADLKHAGIAYRTSKAGPDFHSLRMTSNAVLDQAGIPARIRRMSVRH